MKILMVSLSTLPTMQKYLYLGAENLRAAGVDAVTVGSDQLHVARHDGSRGITIGTPESPRPGVRSIGRAAHAARHIARYILAEDPDVVHFVNKHTWNFFIIRRLRRAGTRARIVHTFHDPIGHHGDRVRRGVILYHRVVQRMLDAVITHSPIAERQTLTELRPSCKVFRVPLGVTAWRSYSPPGSGRKTALIFGRLNPYKGCEMYPQILRAIYDRDPEIVVTIAGKASSQIPDDLLRQIHEAPNARLTEGFIAETEVERYFQDSSVVLTPYTSMTQSGVMLDAYSNSKPVIAFDIDGASDAVLTPETIVDAFDVDAYADRVVKVLTDPDLLEDLSLRSWELGRSCFSIEAMAAGLRAVYAEVIA